ncbi:hypothetical protein M413DRAFT_449782 [Hebeloma cylindrosporum]|uniref:F-box domain-containing protein n=1 Tax=Hebeloma cylindrosporum TaxID=76867 RepID=A0A0C3BVG4_HEBCY|nr:hypothetical protein M413DRAFT_449782 [Hebeloma cylindrosporum h7]
MTLILGVKYSLLGLEEDALIQIISFLEPPDILRLAKTCNRFHEITALRIVWANACKFHVINKGFPFPDTALDSLSTQNLVYHATNGWRLAQRWIRGLSTPLRTRYISGMSGTSISDVRFVPGHGRRFILTISKSVWSAMAIWDMGEEGGEDARKVCEWSPRGAIFNGFALNSDSNSEATVAVSLQLNEQMFVKILHLRSHPGCGYDFEEMYSVDTPMKPVTLVRDLLVLSDDISQTAIWNWRIGSYAILQHTNDSPTMLQSNDCIQVLFAYRSVLVIRARSIHLFPFPALVVHNADEPPPPPHPPIAHHSFCWVDGECVTVCPFLDQSTPPHSSPPWHPLSILVRGESDDPWSSDIHNIELYTLHPNPLFLSSEEQHEACVPPYLFPPRLHYQIPCLRGSLSCKKIILGRFGTAMWIQPRDRFVGGLLADIPAHLVPSSNMQETLVVAVFPGSLKPGPSEGHVIVGKKLIGNDSMNSWTSFDYDEVRGRVVLGSNFGRVTVLDL